MTHGDTKVYTIVYYFGKYVIINKLFVNKHDIITLLFGDWSTNATFKLIINQYITANNKRFV